MKLRTGFVSNSSSSSFAIIGIRDHDIVQKFVAAEQLTEDDMENQIDYGLFEGKHLIYVAGEGYSLQDISTAGVSADQMLEKLTIPEAKKEFVKLCKEKLDVKVSVKDVEFIVSSCGS